MLSIRRIVNFAFIILAFQLNTSAQKQPASAIDLNDYMALISDSLYARGLHWGEVFKQANETKNFKPLVNVRKDLITYIDRKLMDVLKLEDINGSEKLRLAFLDMLFFEKRMITEGFQPFETLEANYTDEKLNDLITKLTNASAEEGEYMERIKQEQHKYADKNGFKMAE